MIRAADQNAGCRAVFENPSLQSLPPTCGQEPGAVGIGDPAPLVLFQLGRLRWQDDTRRLEARGELRKNQHTRTLFEKLIEKYPSSPYADDAALMLLEDRLCYSDEGYPECTMLEIREYEKFLSSYPLSDRKPEVLFRMAERYLDLSTLFTPSGSDSGKEEMPWENKTRAELFLGQAENICLAIQEHHRFSSEAEKCGQLLHKMGLSNLTPATLGESKDD